MYKGLPIITNKIPEHERNGIPHHLLDFIGLQEKPWSVSQFVKASSRIIEEIRSRGKLPIVVGGTHYYTHALLFKDAILTKEVDEGQPPKDRREASQQEFPILSRPSEEMFQKLQEVDPEMARRWHPKDRRKIQRSLEIWLRTGRKASDVYDEQQQQLARGSNTSGAGDVDAIDSDGDGTDETGLRYPTLLLWLEADDAVLKQRLNSRVDSMVEQGLVREATSLASFEKDLHSKGTMVDKSSGIWVSIGYKEMHPWIEGQASDSDPAAKPPTLDAAIESVKAGTRRYAKRQNQYIRIRLANALKAANSLQTLLLFDCSALDRWDTEVAEPTESVVKAFLDGDDLPDPKSLSDLADHMFGAMEQQVTRPGREARTCDICDKTLMSEKEWTGHLASRGHKKATAASRKRQLMLAGNAVQSQNESLENTGG